MVFIRFEFTQIDANFEMLHDFAGKILTKNRIFHSLSNFLCELYPLAVMFIYSTVEPKVFCFTMFWITETGCTHHIRNAEVAVGEHDGAGGRGHWQHEGKGARHGGSHHQVQRVQPSRDRLLVRTKTSKVYCSTIFYFSMYTSLDVLIYLL